MTTICPFPIASIERTTRSLVTLLLAAILSGCGASEATGPSTAAPTSITLQSDAGDYIGAGKSYSFSQASSVINVNLFGKTLTVQVTGDDWWYGNFQLPALQKGTYTVTRSALDWSGAGRGCNTITGTITVDDFVLLEGDLVSLDLRFEQHCEGASAALRGTIHWNALDMTAPPGPTAVPAGTWQPPLEPVTAGNYLYLYSDAGDFIGQGFPWKYTAPATNIAITSYDNHVSVSAAGWMGEFQSMISIGKLQVGYYGNLTRYPFHNPARGGLSWSGQGRGCNKLTGWFVVDRITYSGFQVVAIDMRFEQRCEGGTPALRGVLHFSS